MTRLSSSERKAELDKQRMIEADNGEVVEYTGRTPPPPLDPDEQRLRDEDAARGYQKLDAEQEKVPEGYVYVITNAAYPEWVSVGHSRSPTRRLTSYNRGSPFRDFVIEHKELFDDRFVAEKDVHRTLDALFDRKREWFKCSAQTAINVIKNVRGQHGHDIDLRLGSELAGHQDS
jgi:hypothetical protein